MTKYMIASATALALVLTPLAALAQETGSGNTGKMKGPPNADGYKKDGDKAGGDNKDAGGAGAAKATGEDKK